MQVGELFAKLGLDISGFKSGMSEAKRHMNDVSGAAEKSKGVFSGLGGVMKNAVSFAGGMAIFDGIKNGFKAVTDAGIGFNANMQENEIAFTTMLGSADKAKAMLADLTQFAASTPFELPQVEEGAKKLLAFGFSAEQVKPMLTSIGDAAAGLGLGADGVDRLTMALGQMKAKGKVQGDELLQLTSAGVPALDMLAKGFGKTNAQMQEMVSKGAVPADKAITVLLDGMEKKFPNMMSAQSKSFNGMMSTLKDNVNITFGQVMKPAFDWLTNSVLPKAIDMTSKFQQGFTSGGLAGGIKALLPTFGQVEGAMLKLGIPEEVVYSLERFSENWKEIRDNIVTQLEPIKQVLQGVFNDYVQIARTQFTNLLQVVKMVWPTVRDVITQVARSVMQIIQVAWPVITNVIRMAQGLIMQIIQTAWPIIDQIIKFVMAEIVPFVVEMFGKIASYINEVMPYIQAAISNALNIIQTVWNAVWPVLKVVLLPILEAIKSAIRIAMDLIGGVIKMALALISGDWGLVWRALKETVLNIWGDIVAGIKGFVNLIIRAINAMIDGLNKVSFTAPDWVPVIGGKSWGVHIPHIPTLHTGGTYRASSPGGQGLAMLRDGEKVTPSGQDNERPMQINLHLDGKVIARYLRDHSIQRGRALGVT